MASPLDAIGSMDVSNAIGLPSIDFNAIMDSVFPGLSEFLRILFVVIFMFFCIYLGSRVMKGYKGHLNIILRILGIVGFGVLCIALGVSLGYGIAEMVGLDLTNPFVASIFEYLGAGVVCAVFFIVLRIMFEGPKYLSAKDLGQIQIAINELKDELYEIKSALRKQGIKFKEKLEKEKRKNFKEELVCFFSGFISFRKIFGLVLIVLFVVVLVTAPPANLVNQRLAEIFSFTGIGQSSPPLNVTEGTCLSPEQITYLFNRGTVPESVPNALEFLVSTYPLTHEYEIAEDIYMTSTLGRFTSGKDLYYLVYADCGLRTDCTSYNCVFLGEDTLCGCYELPPE
ncbi:MAG: hypothetical protein PHW96_02115 [Candidatus Nanoarchaeia archaeon]|nr:hypothetical protein [Candidatus Nanoarchaeia archaeon]